MKKIAITATIAACLAGIAAPASAEDVRISVAYGDLDIATPLGAHALADRIAESVRTACAVDTSRTLTAAAAADDCREEMLAGAVAQLNGMGATLAAESVSARG